LRAAFARLADELVSARGAFLRPIAQADPTLVSLELARKAAGLGARMAEDGVWFSADGQAAVLMFETAAHGDAVDAMRDTIADARRTAEEVLRDWPAAFARPAIEFAGAGYFIVKSRDAIGRDAERLSLLGTVLVAGLLMWALRSPRLVGLAAIPVATGALAGFAAVGWANGSIHGITLAFGVTLIGEAVDYAIYTFVQRGDDGAHTPRFWRQLGLAMATSLIGFAAMFFSGFQGLQQLGLFSLVGLMVAAACTRWLLPPLLPASATSARTGGMAPRWVDRPRFGWLPGLGRRLSALRVPLAVCAAVLLVSLWQRGDTLWQDNLDSLSAGTAEDTARDLRYRGDIGMPDLRSMMVVRGADAGEALRRAGAATRLLDRLVAEGRLTGYDNPGALLPDPAAQQRLQAALPEAAVLRERVAEAVRGGKFRAEAFEPFIADIAATRTRAPVDRAYYGDTILGRWLDAQIVSNGDGTALLLLVHGVGPHTRLGDALQASGLPGVTLLDLKGDVETLVAGYRRQTMRTALAGAAGILLLLAVQVRRARAVTAMAAALLATVIVTAWIVHAIEGGLTIFNVVALLLVVGVASNYTLFFSTPEPDPVARQRAGLSVLLAAASTFTVFALLGLSASPVLAMIGQTVAIGAAVGFIAAMVFAPRAAGDA
jgi:predicted exporter